MTSATQLSSCSLNLRLAEFESHVGLSYFYALGKQNNIAHWNKIFDTKY